MRPGAGGGVVNVKVLGWSERDVLARAGGVLVRIRRRPSGIADWICRRCGTFAGPDCEHLQALAEAPADPAHRWDHQSKGQQ